MEAILKAKNQALIIGAATPLIMIYLIEYGANPLFIILTIFAAVARLAWLYRRWRP